MSRRQIVAAAGLFASAALTPVQAAPRPERPRDVGRKFFADGRVRPFAGNTIICHLPQQGEDAELFRALLDIYRQLPSQAFARKMTALPPSSYHMTIFGGANDQDRRRPLWPAGVPLDATMAACNAALAERLRDFRLGEDVPPYRMTVDMTEPASDEAPLTLRLVPADAETRGKLYRLRERLADRLGIEVNQPDDYGFHVTLGYAIDWLTPAQTAAFRATLATWKRDIIARVPIITLGAPEYCLLDDMFHFARQFYLT